MLMCNKSLNREYHWTSQKIKLIQSPNRKKIKYTIFYEQPIFIQNKDNYISNIQLLNLLSATTKLLPLFGIFFE